MNILYPPRPVSKILPTDLTFYENTGAWCVQRKFNGCRNLVNVAVDGSIKFFSRYGKPHDPKAFVPTPMHYQQIRSGLNLEKGVEYWFDSEVMSKLQGATNEIVLYDVLCIGHYLFNRPSQLERLKLLREICRDPQVLEPGGLALQITPMIWMAQTWENNFVDRFNESLPIPKLEGLVLKKKNVGLDNFGGSEYETSNQIRCRKPFMGAESGGNSVKGYNF